MAKTKFRFSIFGLSHRLCRGSKMTVGTEDQLQIFFKGHICSRGVKWNTFWPWPIWNWNLPIYAPPLMRNTNIEGRSCVPPCNSVVSHGALFESICGLCTPHAWCGNPTQTKYAHDFCANTCVSHAHCVAFPSMFFPHAQTAVDTGDIHTWWITVITGKTQILQLEPHARKKNGINSWNSSLNL